MLDIGYVVSLSSCNMKTTNELMTVQQAAQILDVSGEWVRKLVDNGTIKAIRIHKGPRLLYRHSVEQLKKKREQLSA